MSQQTLSDESGTVEVVLSGQQVEAVRISNLWKERLDATALAAALSELIRSALPPRELATPRTPPNGNKHLPVGSVASFVAELQAGRRATRRYIDRLKAGEVRRNPQTWHTDPENRVEISTVGGRFNEVLINPKWAAEASIQTLCDTILDTFSGVALVQEPEPDPDIVQAQRHYDAARAHLAEK